MIDKRHMEMLKHIDKYIKENGFPPTVRELADKLNLKSTSTIQEHLGKLEKEGYIERQATMPRAIKIINKA